LAVAAVGAQGVHLPLSPGGTVRVAHHLLYIDPGSGSLLLQVFLAGFLGLAAAGRKAIGAFFSRLFGKRTDKE
jgi:hypothetical protein